MKLPAYPNYKRTDIRGLRDLPDGWEVKRGRFCMLVNPPSPQLRELTLDDEISFVPMEAVGEYGGLNLATTKPVGDIAGSYTEFQDGDVVVAKITPCFENGKGALAEGLMNRAALGTTELHVLRATEALERKFLFYLTISSFYRQAGEAEMYGAGGQKRVPSEFNKDFRVPLPLLDEQRAIADFLDRETARLETLVGKKRELIEKLKEKRTALISRTVTRGLPAAAAAAEVGLNPHPKLKPSGIEWLGDIPEHWEVKQIKRGVSIVRGKFTHRPRNDPQMYDGAYPFIQTGDVVSAPKFIRGYSQTLSNEGFAVSKMFPSGTLVMTIAANIGDVAILDFPACFPDSIVGLIPSKAVSLVFLFYLVASLRPMLLKSATLNTQLNINNEQIGRILVGFPPLPEQHVIAEYLDRETAKLDRLMEKVEAAVGKLQEYRTALITAAVTGKIDVREAKT